MAKWKCDNCGKVHRRNPRRCRSCGHTVLSQYHGDDRDVETLAKYALVALAVIALAVLLVFLV